VREAEDEADLYIQEMGEEKRMIMGKCVYIGIPFAFIA